MELINFDKYVKNNSIKSYNDNKNVPQHIFRCLTIAGSDQGKTNLLLNMINLNNVFDYIIIYTIRNEDKYIFLKNKNKNNVFIFENNLDFNIVNDLHNENNEYQLLVIIDDYIKDNIEIQKFFIRSRKQNCSVCFLSQNYHSISRLMRNNSNYLLLSGIEKKDINLIYRDNLLNISLNKFYDILNNLKKYNFILIDKKSKEIRLNFSNKRY